MDLETPESRIAAFAILGIAVVSIAYFIRWMFDGPVSPDPWDDTVGAAVRDGDAQPVCHRCFAGHAETVCFCSQCGAAVGEYNNYLPFEYLFSEGEVLRNGTALKLQRSFLVIGGYLLLSIVGYGVLAPLAILLPVYWFFLFRNLLRPVPLEEPPYVGVPPAANE
jgi:hypothetical protein